MGIESRFERALAAFDSVNAGDPNLEEVNGESLPHELVDARRVSSWVDKLRPSASEVLRLASRCQHIKRWEKPRDSYPKTRVGYLQWRQELKKFHAATAAEILREIGYDEGVIQEVSELNLKKGLAAGGDVQVLEDALCLTFLEFEFQTFLIKVSEERMIGILRKTWGKMSEEGRQRALQLSFPEEGLRLIQLALADS